MTENLPILMSDTKAHIQEAENTMWDKCKKTKNLKQNYSQVYNIQIAENQRLRKKNFKRQKGIKRQVSYTEAKMRITPYSPQKPCKQKESSLKYFKSSERRQQQKQQPKILYPEKLSF